MLTRSATLRATSPAGPLPAASLTLIALAAGVALFPGAREALEFNRAALAAGEVWRLLTCHWTHFGPEHLLWDTLAFAVLGILCERHHRDGFVACTAISAIAIPLVVAQTSPLLMTYRGLSGIDSALFAMATVLFAARFARDREWRLLAAVSLVGCLFAAKVRFEFTTGAAVFVHDDAMIPVPWAHVAGGLVGIATGALCAGHGRIGS